MDLFGEMSSEVVYDMPDADIVLYNSFFNLKEADDLFHQIKETSNWQQDNITMYGKQYMVPRLTAWYGDVDKGYTYSGIAMKPNEWNAPLQTIKQRIEDKTKQQFTSVLLNYYRHGKDSMGWHRDNEKELGENPVIASVSFGQQRPFHLRHKYRKDLPTVIIPLMHGSLLLMKGTTQHYWEHQIPKSAKPLNQRINLTFRRIVL